MNQNDVNNLLEDLLNLQNELLPKLANLDNLCEKIKDLNNKNLVVGWIFNDLLDHMLEESKYFKQNQFRNGYDLNSEIEFWNKHSATEMGGTAELVKFSGLAGEAKDLMNKWADDKESFVNNEKMAKEYLKEIMIFGNKIEDKIASHAIPSLSPELAKAIAHHNGKEFQRNKYIYKKLGIMH